ncbi:uncharacterized protein N7487_002868 [Penicillium crustosum]|uniref:uncharacterized protein n=1 Tax=Penicillium crustosum TaxID=36656 RepID=UPI002397C66E|nr:uncharacterized protein N7487_002868 [Penicillium crustosum]KAJ5419318.1 hypothetical protein N7487_002868 [Penicillium crustosum]
MDMDNVNRPAINIWTFFALAALDVAVNAAAGPAAVATAAHVNGSPLTARAMQIGALAGVTKSGVLAFVEFAGFAGLPTPAWILLILVASCFGICVLVTAEVSNLVLGETPSALLIAAVVAAIPLAGECMGLYQCKSIFFACSSPLLILICISAAGGYMVANLRHNFVLWASMLWEDTSLLVWHITKVSYCLSLIMKALGATLFAVLDAFGYDICAYNVAAAAGAVYGVITGFFHVILGCMAGFTSYESTNGHYEIRNVFGTARGYNPNWNNNIGV